ncbi:hypothetical protein ACFTZB_13450 [Rhodococcus sp. NPDC057014]|uniref:hypothetical protein n=1 Tax=Rhodococcus sp. NPDC057014 TaxID=3346000 RepID=UPI003642A572
MAAELPVLFGHGLTMWGYVVLLALDEHPLRTQPALAETIGADKTRIIGVLDDLQDRGLISFLAGLIALSALSVEDVTGRPSDSD